MFVERVVVHSAAVPHLDDHSAALYARGRLIDALGWESLYLRLTFLFALFSHPLLKYTRRTHADGERSRAII